MIYEICNHRQVRYEDLDLGILRGIVLRTTINARPIAGLMVR